MSLFRRDREPKVAIEIPAPYAGSSWAELESWLWLRIPLLDGHAESAFKQRQQLITLNMTGDTAKFVQLLGGSALIDAQAAGATAFGGEVELSDDQRAAMRAAGWIEPDAAAEWRFFTAEVSIERRAGVDQLVRMTLLALRTYEDDPALITVDDTAYPA